MYFLDDSAAAPLVDPLIVGSLVLGLAAVGFGIEQRWTLRANPRQSANYHVFRLDLASAIGSWGAAQTVTVIAWLARIEGARMALWPYLGLLYGAAIVALAWRRDRVEDWSDAAKAPGQPMPIGHGVRSITSATLEFGLFGAAGLALLTYLLTMGHPYPHPIHWLTTAVAGVAGFGVGLMVKTPRARVRVQPHKASPAAPRRARVRDQGAD